MECHNCGKEIPDSAKVCGYCGVKQEVKPALQACPDCGAQVPAAAKACGECGHRFDAIPAPPAEMKKGAPEKPAKAKKAERKTETEAEPAVEMKAEAPQKPAKAAIKSRPPKMKKERPAKAGGRPKWLLPAIAAVAMIPLLIVFFVWRPFLPTTRNSGPAEMTIAGRWAGEVQGVGSDFSAFLEISVNPVCDIGEICGEYGVAGTESYGNLRLESVSGGVYRFKEESLGVDTLEGQGYQAMRLEGDQLAWTFEQELPDGEILRSEGLLSRK